MNTYCRFALLTIAAVVLMSAFAQAQNSIDSTVLNPLARKVQRFYNQNQADSLYAMISEAAKQTVPLDTLKAFLRDKHTKWGLFTAMKLIEIKEGIAYYAATFEKMPIEFSIGQLSMAGKCNTLFFDSAKK